MSVRRLAEEVGSWMGRGGQLQASSSLTLQAESTYMGSCFVYFKLGQQEPEKHGVPLIIATRTRL